MYVKIARLLFPRSIKNIKSNCRTVVLIILKLVKPELIISIIALTFSGLSLAWNIWVKIFDFRKKLLIQCFKYGTCTITLTNIGNKPIFVRRIEIEEKVNGKTYKPNIEYHKYSGIFDMNPLIPDTWRTVSINTTKHFTIYDSNLKEYKETRIIVVEANGKEHKTKWFRQNNLR